MPSGKILRTNYRRMGDSLGITAFGGAIPKSSYMGAAGTNEPYAGFMVFSYCGSFNGDLSTLQTSGPAGCSYAWVESTHAAMSAFYGDAKFGDGYVFLPMGMQFYLYSDVLPGGKQSFPIITPVCIHNSGSLFVVSAVFRQTSNVACDGFSTTFVSQADFKARVWGFIVSTP